MATLLIDRPVERLDDQGGPPSPPTEWDVSEPHQPPAAPEAHIVGLIVWLFLLAGTYPCMTLITHYA